MTPVDRGRSQADAGPPGWGKTWRLAWQVSQHKRRHFWLGYCSWVAFFAFPAAFGYVLSRAFLAVERAAGGEGGIGRVYWLAGLLLAIELARMLVLHHGAIWFMQSWEFMRALLRGNMLTAQLRSGGPEAGEPVRSVGEATARFRDDTQDVASFVDSWIDVSGGAVFTVIALGVLVSVDARATAVLVLPMLLVAATTTVLGTRLQEVHRRDRRATSLVTGLLGDVLAAATTIKVNRAERHVLARLSTVMDRRKATAVRATLYQQAIRAVGQSTAELGLGLVILVAVGSVQRGEFGVAEMSLYLAYGGWLGFLPRMLGFMLARSQQARVAFDEMRALVADRDAANTVTHRPFSFDVAEPPLPTITPPAREPLEQLRVVELTARYGSGGISGVSFAIERGSFTVITGPIGSGKSTLLRAIAGLAWPDEVGGVVLWNGTVVDDRARFFVPPQTAYLAQVPALVSDSLADNVLLGWPAIDQLGDALALAAVDGDIAAMPDGVQTMIGPRGLRLSGGQRQRVATARALVRRPELLLIDDVSSALDVETEQRLWDNLAALETTVLAVSHRRVAIDRADQVIQLDDGRIVPGRLD